MAMRRIVLVATQPLWKDGRRPIIAHAPLHALWQELCAQGQVLPILLCAPPPLVAREAYRAETGAEHLPPRLRTAAKRHSEEWQDPSALLRDLVNPKRLARLRARLRRYAPHLLVAGDERAAFLLTQLCDLAPAAVACPVRDEGRWHLGQARLCSSEDARQQKAAAHCFAEAKKIWSDWLALYRRPADASFADASQLSEDFWRGVPGISPPRLGWREVLGESIPARFCPDTRLLSWETILAGPPAHSPPTGEVVGAERTLAHAQLSLRPLRPGRYRAVVTAILPADIAPATVRIMWHEASGARWQSCPEKVLRARANDVSCAWEPPFPTLKNAPWNMRSNALPDWVERHRGAVAWLIGNGPSVRLADLDALSGRLVFCFNRFHLSYGRSTLRPRYTVMADRQMVEDFGTEILAEAGGEVFVAQPRAPTILVAGGGIISARSGVHWLLQHEGFPPRFSTRAERAVASGGSSVFVAMQLAFRMGVRRFLLYGMDFEYRFAETGARDPFRAAVGEGNHFIENYRAGQPWCPPAFRDIATGFWTARQVIEGAGGFIRNATRGGALEIFDRLSFEAALALR